MSSAHVYLRLQPGQTLDDIPSQLIDDCAQLVKANSIQGNKMNNIDVVYTMWENLNKTGDMDVGQVGFKKNKEVRKVHVEKRINDIVNRLNKTKNEKEIDYRGEREERDRKEREDKKALLREQRQQQAEAERLKEEERKAHSYDTYMSSANMTTNVDRGNDSDDFM
uniref:Coiled-coil domain-containing protein 25 n=1 Tax=Plectus sambesii TaxID=2011161 RepID=A0A914UJN8_9BILA